MLKAAGYGCHIGNVFFGALAYADDIILLAPTRQAVQCMLDICDRFGEEFNVIFNPDKSKRIIFSNSPPPTNVADVVLSGKHIPVVKTDIHLGNPIGSSICDFQINRMVNDLNWRTNVLLYQFKHVFHKTKYFLFNKLCLSLYGSPLLNMCSKSADRLYVTWRKCVRRVLNLPSRTHSNYIPTICDDVSLSIKIQRRFLKFIYSIISSDNDLIRMCANIVVNGSSSNVCCNLNYLCSKLCISKLRFLEMSNHDIETFGRKLRDDSHSAETQSKISVIKELLNMREVCDNNVLCFEEIDNLLGNLCVT